MARQYVAGGASRGVPPMRAILDKGSLPINEKKPILVCIEGVVLWCSKWLDILSTLVTEFSLLTQADEKQRLYFLQFHKSATARH